MSDTQEFTLAAEGKKDFFAGKANYLYLNNATGLVSVELRKNGQAVEPPHKVGQQFNLKNREFDQFIITNISGANNTVRAFYGPGDYDPPADRATVTVDDSDPISVDLASGSVTLNQSNVSNGATSKPDVSVGAGATAAVVTASTSNVRVRVTNLAENSEVMRIGLHNGVGAANGTPLEPGTTLEFNTQAGVWVHNPGAGAESVAVEIETRT